MGAFGTLGMPLETPQCIKMALICLFWAAAQTARSEPQPASQPGLRLQGRLVFMGGSRAGHVGAGKALFHLSKFWLIGDVVPTVIGDEVL